MRGTVYHQEKLLSFYDLLHVVVFNTVDGGHPHIWGTVLAAKNRELTEDRGSDIALRASDA